MAVLCGILFVVVFIVTFAATLLMTVVPLYVVQGISIMKLSEKMGCPCTWQAFLPIFAEYRLGKLAEAACRLENPNKKPFRFGAFYMGVSAGSYAFLGIMTVTVTVMMLFCGLLIGVIGMVGMAGEEYADVLAVISLAALLVVLIVSMVTSFLEMLSYLLVLAAAVLSSVILYKIYNVFAKDHAVWMLLLSLFVSYASSVILLVLAFSEKFTISSKEKQEQTLDCKVEKSTCIKNESVV